MQVCDVVIFHQLACLLGLFIFEEAELFLYFEHLALVSLNEVLFVIFESGNEMRVDLVYDAVELLVVLFVGEQGLISVTVLCRCQESRMAVLSLYRRLLIDLTHFSNLFKVTEI